MTTQDSSSLTFSAFDDNDAAENISKKRKTRIIIIAVTILLVVGLSIFLFLVFGSGGKISEDNYTNYIKAIYYPQVNINCTLFEYKILNFTSSVDSIIIDGENAPITPFYKFNESSPVNKTIIIKFKEKIQNMSYFFHDTFCLHEVDFSNFDSSEVNDISYMFYYDVFLTSITWGPHFSTSKVTRMDSVFAHCRGLTSIDLSNFNTQKVTTFSGMFRNMEKIEKLNLSSFSTSSATDLSIMFNECRLLTSIDLSSFDTKNVKFMNETFQNCENLKTLNLKNFDTSNVINMEKMFSSCSSLEILDLSNFKSNSLVKTRAMVSSCKSLKKIYLNNFVGEVLDDIRKMFSGCDNLTLIDLSNFMGEKCTKIEDIFASLPDNGTLIYDSSKFNKTILEYLPEGWNQTDVKV